MHDLAEEAKKISDLTVKLSEFEVLFDKFKPKSRPLVILLHMS